MKFQQKPIHVKHKCHNGRIGYIYIYYILGNVFRDGTFFQFHSFRSIRNFANLRVPRITMTTPLVNIQFVALKEKERGKEGERDSSNQIHRDSSGHACRSGCTTLYRRLSSPPLDPPPLSTSQHPRTPSSFSLFRSPLDAARPLAELLAPYRT